MLRKARDLLDVDLGAIPPNISPYLKTDKMMEASLKFVNRVDAILAGCRDENELAFRKGITWLEAAERKKEEKITE
jgi:hypothetical protein